jgi:hypothetical protein
MLAWGHAGGDRREGRLVPSQLLSRACQWEKNQGREDKGWMGRRDLTSVVALPTKSLAGLSITYLGKSPYDVKSWQRELESAYFTKLHHKGPFISDIGNLLR